MSSSQQSIDAGTGSAARPGVDPSPAPISSAPPSRSSWWRRSAMIVMGIAAVVTVFSSGILYADLRNDRATGLTATRQLPAPALPAAPPPTPTASAVQAPVNVPVVSQPVGAVRGAPPVQLKIPELKIDQRLVGLRVRADRQLEVPQSYGDIGWWNTGPVAGDPGAALMVGHLDSQEGPAVFYGLSSLTTGAAISVRRADGTTVKFAVTKVQSFAKDHFPDKLVYRTEGKSSLHLLTCGGSYDPSTGYRDNVVVFADLVEPKAARSQSPAKAKPQKSQAAEKAGR